MLRYNTAALRIARYLRVVCFSRLVPFSAVRLISGLSLSFYVLVEPLRLGFYE